MNDASAHPELPQPAGAAERPVNRWAFGLSLALLYITFPLIWMGGLTTTYNAGMAVPDWPTTYGYNLFLYPWTTWLFGPWDLFVEHGHRLLAALAGLVAIALVVATQLTEPRRWVRRFAWGALALVALQGLLGGARVLMDERRLAMIHGCVGPLFFVYAGAMACFTEPAWIRAEPKRVEGGQRLVRLAWLTLVLAYVQLVLGANLRHIPVGASAATFQTFAMFHVVMAVAVLAHGVLLYVRGRQDDVPPLVGGACSRVGVLVGLQVALGLATWTVKYGWPTWLPAPAFAHSLTLQAEGLTQSMTATAHMAVGSMILIHALVAAVRGSRQIAFEPAPAYSGAPSLQECVA